MNEWILFCFGLAAGLSLSLIFRGIDYLITRRRTLGKITKSRSECSRLENQDS